MNWGLPIRGSSAVAAALLFSCAIAQQKPVWLDSFQNAFSELRSGNFSAANAELEQLWKANPRDVILAVSAGGALDATSHHEEAVIWYRRALAIEPENPAALMDMALNYAVRGQLEKAAPLLRKLLRVDPGNAKAAYNLGLVDLRLGQNAEAAEVFRKAAESSSPPATAAQIRLAEATALFHAHKYSETAVLLSGHGEESAAGLLLLGSAQALLKNLPAAITTFQKAVRLFPNNPQTYYRLALALISGGRNQDAQEVITAGLGQTGSAPLLEYAMALVEDRKGDFDAAESWAKKSLAANQRQPDAWLLLGSIYAGHGFVDQALDAYRQALRTGGGLDPALACAELLIRNGRTEEAEEELRQIAGDHQDNPRVARVLGRLYRTQKDYARAEEYFRHAIRLDPGDADAHFGLAETLRFTGRRAEAQKEYAIFMKEKNAARMVRLLEVAGERN